MHCIFVSPEKTILGALFVRVLGEINAFCLRNPSEAYNLLQLLKYHSLALTDTSFFTEGHVDSFRFP